MWDSRREDIVPYVRDVTSLDCRGSIRLNFFVCKVVAMDGYRYLLPQRVGESITCIKKALHYNPLIAISLACGAATSPWYFLTTRSSIQRCLRLLTHQSPPLYSLRPSVCGKNNKFSTTQCCMRWCPMASSRSALPLTQQINMSSLSLPLPPADQRVLF